jgi:phosphonate transport system permease protein
VNRLAFGNTSLIFLISALLCLSVADIAITALNPWGEMLRLLRGILRPDVLSIEAWSVIWTVAFAVVGVGIGATAGFLLAIVFPHFAAVRGTALVLRSIHELFWALLLIQVFGLGPTTGVLAIAIPYAGIFAKVFAEIIEEADLSAERVLPAGTSAVSAFAFARLPEVADRFKTYTLYRLECGLRSTLVLGFVGLPTVGFHLEGYFKQGQYGEAAALLGTFYVLIGTRRLWARPATVPILLIGSLLLLPEGIGGGSALANLARFVTHDIVPAPLRSGDLGSLATWGAFASWLQPIFWRQILPGVWNTVVLSQIALVGMGLLALALFPLVSRRFIGRIGQPAGRVLLVVVRSTPEYMLAYVLLQLLGPSMLPAIIALAVHNGAIVGYLMGRHADALDYRMDAPQGVNLYAYDTVTRLYGQFLA